MSYLARRIARAAAVCAAPSFFLSALPSANAAPVLFAGTGSYYDKIDASIDYGNAKSAASSLTFMGATGHLVAVTSSAENSFLLSTFNPDRYWIGGEQATNSASTSTGWSWITGESWAYTAWNSVEPNDGAVGNTVDRNVENRVIFFPFQSEFGWNDVPESFVASGFIVEYNVATVVPEAGTLALLGFALVPVGIGIIKRRK